MNFFSSYRLSQKSVFCRVLVLLRLYFVASLFCCVLILLRPCVCCVRVCCILILLRPCFVAPLFYYVLVFVGSLFCCVLDFLRPCFVVSFFLLHPYFCYIIIVSDKMRVHEYIIFIMIWIWPIRHMKPFY